MASLFYEVQSRHNSHEPRMRQANIVLNAVNEVIERKIGKKLSEGETYPVTAYFAALMSFLETDESEGSMVAAVAFLLGYVFKKIDPNVLKAKAERTAILFTSVLTNHNEDNVACRWSLECSSILLSSLDRRTWLANGSEAQAVTTLFQALCVFSTDLRPRIRKSAQAGVQRVLNNIAQGGFVPKVSNVVQQALLAELSQCTPKDCQGAMFACGLLQKVVHDIPPDTARAILSNLFTLAAKGSPVLLIQAMRTASAVFDFQGDKTNKQSYALIADILDTMLTIKPHKADNDTCLPYLSATSKGLEALARSYPSECLARIHTAISSVGEYLLSPRAPVVLAASHTLKTIVGQCLSEYKVLKLSKADRKELRAPVAKSLETLLSYKYKTSWAHSFSVVEHVLGCVDLNEYPSFSTILLALDSLHQGALSGKERKGLEAAVLAAIIKSGPEQLEAILPLHLPKTECSAIIEGSTVSVGSLQKAIAVSRAWILPLLQSGVKSSNHTLEYYFTNLWPTWKTLVRCVGGVKKVYPAEGSQMDAIQLQLIATLPSFATNAQDMDSALQKNAKQWAIGIQKSTGHVRQNLCKALACLVQSAREAAAPARESDMKEENPHLISRAVGQKTVKVAQRLSKNFLSILFDAALQPDHPSVTEACVHAASEIGLVAPEKGINSMFIALLKKLLQIQAMTSQDEEEIAQKKAKEQAMADLALGLIPCLNASSLDWMMRTFIPLLKDEEAMLQKKAYRVVRAICEKKPEFFVKNSEKILTALKDALGDMVGGVSRQRLLCFEKVLPRLAEILNSKPEAFKFLGSFVGEIILSCKESNAKARETAFGLSVKIGAMLKESKANVTLYTKGAAPGDPYPLLTEYFSMVSAGLAGTTPRMQGATVSVLARLIYEFHKDITDHTLSQIMKSIRVLLDERSREVVKAILGFAKVVSIRVEPKVLGPYLPDLVQGLCKWADDSKNKFRQKIRAVFVALANRFGSDTLAMLVTDKHQPLVEHIRKECIKKAKEKAERWSEHKRDTKTQKKILGEFGQVVDASERKIDEVEKALFDEDDEDDDFNAFRGSGSKRNTGSGSMAIVDPDIDFLGSSAARRVVRGSDKSLSRLMEEERKREEIKMDEEGKIVIEDPAEREKAEALAVIDASGRNNGLKRHGSKKRSRSRDPGTNRRAHSGKRFKSRKGAGGDVKTRETNVDPYAYVPMNPAHLNKRKALKARRAFESVVSAAKAGGKKGKSLRKRDNGRRNRR
ncbi:hypothetical protein AAMO2058_000807800 [Amorphochlora amoebiformis]